MAEHGITILGTGGDSVVVGRLVRSAGGIVVTTPRAQLHIDPGTGALAGLARNGLHPRETTAILLSHQHVNHAGEAAALISAMTHNGMDKRGLLISNQLQDSFVPEHHQRLTEKSIAIAAGTRIGINDMEVKAIGAKHYDTEALSYLVQTPTYLLGYTGDAAYSEEWAKSFAGANILIINCKYPDGAHDGDHLSVEDVISLVAKVQPQLAVITHFGAKMLDADPLAQARRIHQATKVQVVAAKDGLRIAPSSYDVKQQQKTLKGF